MIESLLLCEFAGTVERQDLDGAISDVNVYTANGQASQDATHSSLHDRNNLSEPDAASVNRVAAKDNTSYRKSGGEPTALPVVNELTPPAGEEPVKDEATTSKLKDNTNGGPIRKLSRQFSKDSQRSGT